MRKKGEEVTVSIRVACRHLTGESSRICAAQYMLLLVLYHAFRLEPHPQGACSDLHPHSPLLGIVDCVSFEGSLGHCELCVVVCQSWVREDGRWKMEGSRGREQRKEKRTEQKQYIVRTAVSKRTHSTLAMTFRPVRRLFSCTRAVTSFPDRTAMAGNG